METVAVVWTFKQACIPTAVLRFISDLARGEASLQILCMARNAAEEDGGAGRAKLALH